MYETVNHYKGTIRQYETPNEPELNAKPYIPYEIVQQWKRAYIGAKKADLDTVFIAGDHTSSVRSVLPPELELGAYYYADAFSWHPYVYNAMPDGGIESFIRDIGEMINEYGGWRDFYLTEGGWPTAQGGFPNVSEEVQRDYIVRAFLIYMTYPQIKAWQYYDFKNDGTDENYYEVFWGISDVDGRPKLAYGAVNNLMTTLSHTVYAGPLDTQDDKIRGYVFMNDYQPVITVWRSVDHKDDPNEVPQTSLLRLNVGSNTVTVRDINGNESIQKTKNGVVEIMVSGSPVYIIGASASVLNDAYGRLLNNDYLDTLKKMEKLEANSPEAARSLRLRLGTIQARLESALKDHRLVKKAEALENCIIDIYDIMKQAAVKVQRGELDREDAFVVSEALYYYAETASNVLIHVKGLQGVRDVNLQYADHLNQARNAYELKSGEHYILPVATSATMRLNRYARMAEMYRERSRYAESAVYQLMTREFAKSVLQIVAADQSLYTGVWLNVSPIRMSGEPGYTSRVTGTVSNETAAAQSVAILLEKPDGWGEVQSYDVEIAPNDVYRFDLPLVIPLNAAKGSYKPKIVVRHEGTVIDEAVIDFRVNDAIQAKLLPVNSPVEELNEITVLLTGISDDAKNGKVIMRGPDGNELLPVSGNTFTNLSKGQSLALTFNWDYRTKHAYNDYRNELSVVDTDNDTVMFEDRQMPLDFLFIPKRVSPIVIDGQLEDWKQAYPVHLRGAERNISGIYDPVNLDATAYAMWDEQHFYIAMVVTDNIHKNAEDAPNLWKNDSIQIAFDPLSDSSANYNSDDMEWGFAMRDDGTHLANIFFSRPPNPNGNVSGQLPYRIIRDEPNQKTFYEIQIPKEMIAHLQLAEGTVFGYNIAVNDADYQMGRDNFIQWTRGLADSKNPGNFDKFTFVN